MQAIHTIEVGDGSNQSQSDRLKVVLKLAVANLIGGGAGQTVTVAVVFAETMPANYAVFADPGQDAVCFVTARTAAGFTLNINPRLAANTLAAGTVNILVVG